jgi:hypothetical protein
MTPSGERTAVGFSPSAAPPRAPRDYLSLTLLLEGLTTFIQPVLQAYLVYLAAPDLKIDELHPGGFPTGRKFFQLAEGFYQRFRLSFDIFKAIALPFDPPRSNGCNRLAFGLITESGSFSEVLCRRGCDAFDIPVTGIWGWRWWRPCKRCTRNSPRDQGGGVLGVNDGWPIAGQRRPHGRHGLGGGHPRP